MSYLEEWLIYSWIKFSSIKLRINLLSEDKKDSIPIDENTNPKEFMNIKFLCKFAQNNLDINYFNQKKDLNNQENYQSENNNDKLKDIIKTPEDICEFFKKFEKFCEDFFSCQLDSQISSEMKSLFKNYTSNNKIIYKTETRINLLLFYKIIFYIRFIQDLLINLNTNQINFIDILEKYANFKKLSMQGILSKYIFM